MPLKPYLFDDIPQLTDEVIKIATTTKKAFSRVAISEMLESFKERVEDSVELAAAKEKTA